MGIGSSPNAKEREVFEMEMQAIIVFSIEQADAVALQGLKNQRIIIKQLMFKV